MKSWILTFLLIGLTLTAFAQNRTCQSLHVGTFKAISKEQGTTIIKRTKKTQVEENTSMGYKLLYTVTWINDCIYELRLRQVIKGDPSWINDAKYVLTVRIKQIKKNSYTTENSNSFSNGITQHEIMIVQ